MRSCSEKIVYGYVNEYAYDALREIPATG